MVCRPALYSQLITNLYHQHTNKVQHYFSSEQYPTLWCALPAIEELQTAWESKHDTPRFYIYKDVINDGLEKLKKYYSHFDKKPSYILTLGTFPSDMNSSILISF